MHHHWRCLLVGLALASCLEKVDVVEDGTGTPSGVSTSRSCSGPSDCPASQRCCPTGLSGSCVSLEGDAPCPAPDLQVFTLAGSLSISERTFDRSRIEDACAYEKGCIEELGLRRLLHFGVRTTNTGSAALILGAPGSTPGFEPAACDGRPYFEDYLRYTLVDSDTAAEVAEGHMQALCEMPPRAAAFRSPFGCQYLGLWPGFSEVYGPNVADCQWVDITDVAPGAYLLRVDVNPDGRLSESDRSNNTVAFQIVLPAGDPTSICPVPYDGLSGYGAARECGWSFASRATDTSARVKDQVPVASTLAEVCTPGTTILEGCATCTGVPMLRVCDGVEAVACSAREALASAIPFATDDACASASFTCPASGGYRVLVATYAAGTGGSDLFGLATQPAGCELVLLSETEPGGL